MNRGGQFITDKLQEQLQEKAANKIKIPYVRNKAVLEHPVLGKQCYSEFFDDVKKAVCKVYESSDKHFFNKIVDNKVYELPDDQNIIISREYYDVPELLFKNSERDQDPMPIQKSIAVAMEKIPLDKRKDILSNIILSGGTANLHGLVDRLQKILISESQEDSSSFGKIKICGNKLERQHSNWLGASVIASMNIFKGLLMTKREYEEHGSQLIERKCD